MQNNKTKSNKTWYTVVTDDYGFSTIRVARHDDEKMASSFEELKADLKRIVADRKTGLLQRIYELDLNMESLNVLRVEDTLKESLDSRNLH